jgi:hypothetical protein
MIAYQREKEMFSTYDNCEVLMLNWHLDRLINIPIQLTLHNIKVTTCY